MATIDKHKEITEVVAVNGNSPVHRFPGGLLHFSADGSFQTGTALLQFRLLGGDQTFKTTAVSLTADGQGTVNLPRCDVRANISGANAGVSINCHFQLIPAV